MRGLSSAALYALGAEVRAILLRDWDPIGISGFPEAQDEYDSYVPGIVALLQEKVDQRGLAGHLLEIETRRMELRSDPARSERVAGLLLDAAQRVAPV